MDTGIEVNIEGNDAPRYVPTDRRLSLQYPLWIEHLYFLRQQNPNVTLDQAIMDFSDHERRGSPPYGVIIGDEIDRRYGTVMASCDSKCGVGNCPGEITYCAKTKNEIKAELGLPIIDGNS
ncbi:MAG TPA: hypothetical protein VJI15_02695 [Candidatus Nanoarchaeia archaeon]|nr:hypothetical protein [Candidatus Nanoarchaeia archaeon]